MSINFFSTNNNYVVKRFIVFIKTKTGVKKMKLLASFTPEKLSHVLENTNDNYPYIHLGTNEQGLTFLQSCGKDYIRSYVGKTVDFPKNRNFFIPQEVAKEAVTSSSPVITISVYEGITFINYEGENKEFDSYEGGLFPIPHMDYLFTFIK